jgi:hypothetical protein
MDADIRAALRGLGAVGAIIAAFATFVAWYSFQVVLGGGGVLNVFGVPATLWGVTTLAPILLSIGAVVALFCITMSDSRAAGAIAALIGIGITAYAIVRCFDLPSLGVRALAPLAPGARAATTLEGGPFLEIVGGIMIALGSLPNLVGAPEEAQAPAGAERGGRFRRGAPAPASRAPAERGAADQR